MNPWLECASVPLTIFSALAFCAAKELEYRSDELALLQNFAHWRDRTDALPYPSTIITHVYNELDGDPLLIKLDKKGRCMTGYTPSILLAANKSKSKGDSWMFHLKGGGLCATKEECDLEAERAYEWSFEGLSSSSGGSRRALIDLVETNPFRLLSPFDDWNHVYLPYCSKDLWTGTASEPTDNSFGYIFGGHNIFVSAVEFLMNFESLATAKNIVLRGISAGGHGAFSTSAWLQEQLPHVNVRALPVAGHFWADSQYQGPHKNSIQKTNITLENTANLVNTWSSWLPEKCTAALPETPEYCLWPPISSKYNAANIFVVQAQTDSAMLTDHSGISKLYRFFAFEPQITFVDQWHRNQSRQLRSNLKDTDGLFNPACFIHDDFYEDLPLIDNMSYVTAFTKWYLENTTMRLVDQGPSFSGVCPEGPPDIVWPKFPYSM